MTEYIVLVHTEDGWGQVGPDQVQARSAHAAIERVVKQRTDSSNGSKFVAVPARSWKPVSVTVQTETKIKIG